MTTILQAIGTPRRREILRLVWQREMSAGAIHRSFGDVTFGAVSQHLGQLERAGLLEARREGQQRVYSVKKESLGPLAAWLESTWDDALYRLKIQAELEHARRGPRSRDTTAQATARRRRMMSKKNRSTSRRQRS